MGFHRAVVQRLGCASCLCRRGIGSSCPTTPPKLLLLIFGCERNFKVNEFIPVRAIFGVQVSYLLLELETVLGLALVLVLFDILKDINGARFVQV